MYISDKFLKFSVNKLFKFRHISKIKYVYCVVHVAIQTLFWFISFIYTYAYARTHRHTHTETQTHTHARKYSHRLKFFNFLERLWKQMSNWDNTGPQNLIQAKFKIFDENIRSNKDSGQIQRNKLTYLHYLNKNDWKTQDEKVHF